MQLLSKQQIAAAFATSANMAASILAENGVKAIDLGRGRGRGRKWLKSEVERVILLLHQRANPKPKENKPRAKHMPTPLHSMSIADLHRLTSSPHIQ